jgi:transposase
LINAAVNKDEMIAQLSAQNSALKEQLDKANTQILWFKEQIKLIRHRHFGRQSEKTESMQFSLFDESESDEVLATETQTDAQKMADLVTVTYTRPRNKKIVGRKIDTSNLPRERIVHDLASDQKTCACSALLALIGEDVSEQLELIPAQLKVIEHVKLKYACKDCKTIISAKKEIESPIAKSMAGSTLIADVIIKKYDHHLPLYRQSKIFAQSGVIIPDNTLGNWVMGAADVLSPLGDALWKQVIKSRYIQADETPVKILKPDKKGYMWAYHSLESKNRFIAFEFNISRSASVPENRLKYFKGLLQTDGYAGYHAIGKQEGVIHYGCWDHARRKFVAVIKVSGNPNGIAGQLLTLINSLYEIEREIKEKSTNDRYQTRQEKSKPILEKIFSIGKSIKALPKSTLGDALTYLKNNEPYLMRYIDDGRAQMSNILTENQMRPFAIGRKNWMFVGNEDSANKSALLYSLIQSCKINNIDMRKYLIYVLNKAHAMRRGDVDAKSLLPQFIDPELLK